MESYKTIVLLSDNGNNICSMWFLRLFSPSETDNPNGWTFCLEYRGPRFSAKKLIYNKNSEEVLRNRKRCLFRIYSFFKISKKILRNRFDEIFNRYLETYRLPYFQHFAHQSMNVISTSMKLFTGLNEKKIIYNHKILIEKCNTSIFWKL